MSANLHSFQGGSNPNGGYPQASLLQGTNGWLYGTTTGGGDNGAGTVTMHLAQPWGPFLATLAQPLGSIMDKAWTINMGGWDDSCDTWQDWYATNSAEDPLSAVANGTGPFQLERWDLNAKQLSLTAFKNYRSKPAAIKRVIMKTIPEFGTRRLMLEAGDADIIDLP